MQFSSQTALDVPWAGKCAGENNGSTIDSIVLAKVARGRSSPRTTKNADWFKGTPRLSILFHGIPFALTPDWKVCRMCGDPSYFEIACVAVFVSQNNSSIISFCCFTKISWLEPRLKFEVRGREIGRAKQTFQSGSDFLVGEKTLIKENL